MAIDSKGISSQHVQGAVVRDEKIETKQPEAKQPVKKAQDQGDVIVKGGEAKAPTAGTTDLERRVAEMELREQQRAAAERAKQEAEVLAAKEKGWFTRAVSEVFEFIARACLGPFSAMVNMVSLFVRVARVGYKWLKGEQIDWKKEGLRALGDLAGAILPTATAFTLGPLGFYWGGLIAGGINTGLNLADKDKSQILGREIEQESGLRVAGRKAMEFYSDVKNGVEKKLTGKDPVAAEKAKETGVDYRFVDPSSVPVT